MRTLYFPLERENPEILRYLLETVLYQQGMAYFATANTTIKVTVMDNLNSGIYPVTYIVALTKKPDDHKYSCGKFCGITTDDLREVEAFITSYINEPANEHRTKAKVRRVLETNEP